jgi:hypothetical protein
MNAVVMAPEVLRLTGCIEQTFSVEEQEAAVSLLICSRDRPSELVFK